VQVLAAYCQSYGRWVTAERMIAKIASLDPQSNGLLIKNSNGNAMPNPLIFVAINAARDMVKYAAEFGFTPAARTRIAVEQSTKQQSKFSGLLG
jgi:P27 family predicted phage terminase small subunit